MTHRIAIPALVLTVLCGNPNVVPAETLFGEPAGLGNATVRSYAVVGADGRLTAIGVSFKADALEGLPEAPNTTSRCFDLDRNGRINDHGECEAEAEKVGC